VPEVGTSTNLAVSIQARGNDDAPWEGHLATGVLTARDQVLVPGHVEEIHDPQREFEVLIFTSPPSRESPVDRIVPTHVDTYHVGGRSVGTVIKLGRPSSHLPMVPDVDGCTFGRAMEASGGDLRRTLETLGLIGPGALDRPDDEVFSALPRLEWQQRRPWQRDIVLDGRPGSWWCPTFLISCHPCND
jgi:hypothetical protein